MYEQMSSLTATQASFWIHTGEMPPFHVWLPPNDCAWNYNCCIPSVSSQSHGAESGAIANEADGADCSPMFLCLHFVWLGVSCVFTSKFWLKFQPGRIWFFACSLCYLPGPAARWPDLPPLPPDPHSPREGRVQPASFSLLARGNPWGPEERSWFLLLIEVTRDGMLC